MMYNKTAFVFCSTAIYQTGVVHSFLNIQYQSTGLGSLPLLIEIQLRRSIRVVFSWQYGTLPIAFRSVLLGVLQFKKKQCFGGILKQSSILYAHHRKKYFLKVLNDINKHTGSQNDQWMMWFKPMLLTGFFICTVYIILLFIYLI